MEAVDCGSPCLRDLALIKLIPAVLCLILYWLLEQWWDIIYYLWVWGTVMDGCQAQPQRGKDAWVEP